MTVEKKVEALEGELKLMKGEIKESLVNVRDFLASLKLPLPTKDLDAGSDNQLSIRGGLSVGSDGGTPQYPPRDSAEPPREAPARQSKPPAQPRAATEPRSEAPLPEVPQPKPENLPPAPEPPQKAVPHPHMDGRKGGSEAPETIKEDKMGEQMIQTNPQVNLLANLIRWVSVARNEIGSERLLTFLEVYAISGDLSPELKEVILHLADVVVETSADGSAPDVWSRLLLELHGILTGGGTPLRPLNLLWNNEGNEVMPDGDDVAGAAPEGGPAAVEEDRPVRVKGDRPVRLKLVVPVGDDMEKEFDVDEFSVSLNSEVAEKAC